MTAQSQSTSRTTSLTTEALTAGLNVYQNYDMSETLYRPQVLPVTQPTVFKTLNRGQWRH